MIDAGTRHSTDGHESRGRSAAIDAVNIEKRFGGIFALKGVSLEVAPGTVHALVGENGAGKSTFLGVIAGRVVPSAGDVRIFGAAHQFGTPRHAHHLGISAIYQELTIVPALSAVANVFLGQTLSRRGLLSNREMSARFDELCSQLGVAIPANMPAGRLSVASQQMLEIMRGVQSQARILLFDEPTTALAPPERLALFRIMRQLREQGTTMMLVSHNLEEVLENSDVVTVFRDGKVAASAGRDAWTKRDLVRAMIGHDVPEAAPRKQAASRRVGVPLLSAGSVTLPSALEGIDIGVHAGEIVGIGGLVGSGRSSLLRCLAGLEPQSRGEMRIDGVQIPWPRTPRRALRAGISLVPEDRKTQGLVLGMSAMDNIAMTRYRNVSRLGILSHRAMLIQSREVAREFGFAEDRVTSVVRNLSGGNQQKILLGKWRYRRPKILLVDEPTRGIDIGAKEDILDTLRRLADEGLAIIVVSSELEEVVALSVGVVVLAEGRAVAELDASTAPLRVQDILNSAFKVGADEHNRT